MLSLVKRWTGRESAPEAEEVGERAGQLFDAGHNCAQSVLKAHLGKVDPSLMEIAEAFGGGINGRKCLCGAISGGVMALSLQGKKRLAGKLVDAFKERNKITCCKGLSAPYTWKSKEHLANCRRLTAETAAEVERLLRG